MVTNKKEYHKIYMRKYSKNPKRIEYMKSYFRKWNKTPKRIAWIKKYVRSNKHKEYNSKWQLKNKNLVRAKFKRYYGTIKGIVNQLKKHDARRLNIKNQELNVELIKNVNERDLSCVYCGRKFINKDDRKEFDYDHINSFIPFSKDNIVKACKQCNKEKSCANTLEWCKFKGYVPAPIVIELYNKLYSS